MSYMKLLNAFIVIRKPKAMNITVDMEAFLHSFNIAMNAAVTSDKVQNYMQNVYLQFYHSPHVFMQFQHFLKLFYSRQVSAFDFVKQLLTMFMGYPFLTAGITDLLPQGYQLHETEKYIIFIYPNGQIQPISKKSIVDP
ncbi:Transcriptional regulatory protein [Trichinella pseudospiralis]